MYYSACTAQGSPIAVGPGGGPSWGGCRYPGPPWIEQQVHRSPWLSGVFCLPPNPCIPCGHSPGGVGGGYREGRVKWRGGVGVVRDVGLWRRGKRTGGEGVHTSNTHSMYIQCTHSSTNPMYNIQCTHSFHTHPHKALVTHPPTTQITTHTHLYQKLQPLLWPPPHGVPHDSCDGRPFFRVLVNHGSYKVDRLWPMGEG